MTPTDEQIAEALAQADHDIMVAPLTVLASALRAAQERVKELEAKTVPMEMLEEIYKSWEVPFVTEEVRSWYTRKSSPC